VTLLKLIFGATLLAVVGSAGATETLKDLTLPAVTKAPWRFKEFPILAWWAPPGSEPAQAFADYRDAGFSIYPLNPDRHFEDGLVKAADAGLSIMPFIKKQGFDERKPKKDVKYPEDHPNVVGWITYDEPNSLEEMKLSITSVNELMRKDPTRWAMFNCLPPHVNPPNTKKLVEAAVRNGMPIISYDNYVIHADGTSNEAQHFTALELYRQLSLKHDVPFWAFALSIKHFHYRRASESDLRWKQFTNLAYGAKGLWYFTFWGPTDWDNWDNKAIVNPADGSKTEMYHYAKAINDNVQSMGDVLLNLTSTQVMHTTGTPEGQLTFEKGRHWISDIEAEDAIVSLFRHKDGGRYAMIVNKQHAMDTSAADLADTMTLTFARRVKSVDAVAWLDGKPGPLEIKDNMTTMTIAGGTGVLLKMGR
jgi:hypothetical protein